MKAVYALVAVLTVGWITGFVISLGGPSEPPPPLYDHLMPAAMVGLPWLAAVLLLRHGWSTGTRSTMDTPARLLAAAVATLPEDRREWGAAMTAELAQVPDRPARWSFAVGCTWAAVFPPRANRSLVMAVGALATAAVIIAGLAVGGALPAMRLFAVAFVGLVGALVLLAVARSRRVRPAAPVTAAVGLLGVAACIAVTGYFLVEYPIGALHLPPTAAVGRSFRAGVQAAVWTALLTTLAFFAIAAVPRRSAMSSSPGCWGSRRSSSRRTRYRRRSGCVARRPACAASRCSPRG